MNSASVLIGECVAILAISATVQITREVKIMWAYLSKFIALVKGDLSTPRAKLVIAALENESSHSAILAAKSVLEGLSSHQECGAVFSVAVEALEHVLKTTPE